MHEVHHIWFIYPGSTSNLSLLGLRCTKQKTIVHPVLVLYNGWCQSNLVHGNLVPSTNAGFALTQFELHSEEVITKPSPHSVLACFTCNIPWVNAKSLLILKTMSCSVFLALVHIVNYTTLHSDTINNFKDEFKESFKYSWIRTEIDPVPLSLLLNFIFSSSGMDQFENIKVFWAAGIPNEIMNNGNWLCHFS